MNQPLVVEGSVGTGSEKLYFGGTFIHGKPSYFELVNTHGSQTLSISFDDVAWYTIAAAGGVLKIDEPINSTYFYLKGSGLTTTYKYVVLLN